MSRELEYVLELDGRVAPIRVEGLELRPPERRDVEVLYDVYRDAFSTRTSELLDEPTWLAKWPLDPACDLGLSIIGFVGSTAIAYLLVDLDESRPEVAAVAQLGVRVRHRRRGVGRAVLDGALAGFARAGFSRASLRVAPDNRDAIRLYERLGFTASRTA